MADTRTCSEATCPRQQARAQDAELVRGIVAAALLICGTLFLVNGPGPLLSGNMALTLGAGSLLAGCYLAARWLIGLRTT